MTSPTSTSNLLSGTALARDTVAVAGERAAAVRAATGVAPCLATVLIGSDPASVTYVRMKQQRAAKAGIDSRAITLDGRASTAEAVDTVAALSADPDVHGILVQHPAPSQVDERAVFEAIAPGKDVDGVTRVSYAAMAFAEPGFVSCTPGGMLRLLDHAAVELSGLHAVVVGRSAILGKPMAALLLARDATVTTCHSRTRDLPEVLRTADLVVAAVGRPAFVRGDWLRDGVVVLDAGYNPGNVGDVAFEEAVGKARWITPVPGGVGPMTIAVLLDQAVTAAEQQLVSPSRASGR